MGAPSLEELIQPVPLRTFFSAHWEKASLVVTRGAPRYFERLLSLDEIDRVLTTLDVRYPDVSIVNAAGVIPSEQYTSDRDRIDPTRAYELLGCGSTIVLSQLHLVLPTLAELCIRMERIFSSPFQTNVYMTPANAQGFRQHYDTHDVFILQVIGAKKWRIFGAPVSLPLRNQDYDEAVHQPGHLQEEFILRAGDTAYVPRGYVHDAVNTGAGTSLHVTLGALAYTWTDVLIEAVAATCLEHPEFRRGLPPGFMQSGRARKVAQQEFRKLLQRLANEANLEPVLQRLEVALAAQSRPMLRGHSDEIRKLAGLTMDSVVRPRQSVIFTIREDKLAITITCFGREIVVPRHAAAAVRFALKGTEFAVRCIPGGLDDAGKLTLVRRLVREGLLTIGRV